MHVAQDVLLATLYGCAYFGPAIQKKWVITLVLIVSAFGCISGFVNVIQPAGDIKALLAKIFFSLWLLFFGYQIVFFRKANVRGLFRDKGTLYSNRHVQKVETSQISSATDMEAGESWATITP